MGLTHVAVKLRKLGFSGYITTQNSSLIRELWTQWLRHSNSRRIGIKPVGKRTYELANGELVENMSMAIAELTFMDEIISTRIIFGPDNS